MWPAAAHPAEGQLSDNGEDPLAISRGAGLGAHYAAQRWDKAASVDRAGRVWMDLVAVH